jgi:hypothetical protein
MVVDRIQVCLDLCIQFVGIFPAGGCILDQVVEILNIIVVMNYEVIVKLRQQLFALFGEIIHGCTPK